MRYLVLILFLFSIYSSTIAQTIDSETNIDLGNGQAVTVGELLFDSSIDGMDTWEQFQGEQASLSIDGNSFIAQSSEQDIIWTSFGDIPHTNVVIQMDITQISTALNNGYGGVCRGDADNKQGYYFFISGDEFYSFILGDAEGNPNSLIAWEPTPLIQGGQASNTITIICYEDVLTLYINDELVATTVDNALSTGTVALSIATFNREPIEVRFDRVQVWEIDGEAEISTVTVEPRVEAEPTATNEPIAQVEVPTIVITPEPLVAPQTLTQHTTYWTTAIEELQEKRLVGFGGSLLFVEDFAFTSGAGLKFVPLAPRSSRADVVFSTTLQLNLRGADASGSQRCSFLFRTVINDSGIPIEYGAISLTSMGELVLTDLSDVNALRETSLRTDIDITQTHHLLVRAMGETATVYLNGELVGESIPITDRVGGYGILVMDEATNSRCNSSNIWAHEVERFEEGVCFVQPVTRSNLRDAPSVQGNLAGTLSSDEAVVSIAKTQADDGFIWWQLEDNTWIRDDLVNETGDCLGISILE